MAFRTTPVAIDVLSFRPLTPVPRMALVEMQGSFNPSLVLCTHEQEVQCSDLNLSGMGYFVHTENA